MKTMALTPLEAFEKNTVRNIKLAWGELKRSTLQAVWKRLLNQQNSTGDTEIDVEGIIEVGRQIAGEGFADRNREDINEILDADGSDIAAEEMIDIFQQLEPSEETATTPQDQDNMTATNLATILAMGDKLVEEVSRIDPDEGRSNKFHSSIIETLQGSSFRKL